MKHRMMNMNKHNVIQKGHSESQPGRNDGFLYFALFLLRTFQLDVFGAKSTPKGTKAMTCEKSLSLLSEFK